MGWDFFEVEVLGLDVEGKVRVSGGGGDFFVPELSGCGNLGYSFFWVGWVGGCRRVWQGWQGLFLLFSRGLVGLDREMVKGNEVEFLGRVDMR